MPALKTLILSIAVILCSSYSTSTKVFLRKLIIGKFSYSIYEETVYSHDDDLNINYFVIYKSGKTKRLCSAYMSGKRNDSTFIEGRYKLYSDRIEFTENFYYKKNQASTDSIKTIFYPNKYGDLKVTKSTWFEDGKRSQILY